MDEFVGLKPKHSKWMMVKKTNQRVLKNMELKN